MRMREILEDLDKGNAKADELILQVDVWTSRVNYVIRIGNIDIIYSMFRDSIFPSYMAIVENGVETKIYEDIETEKELFTEYWYNCDLNAKVMENVD